MDWQHQWKKYLKKNLRGNEKPTNSYYWEFWYDHERNKESSEWYKQAKSWYADSLTIRIRQIFWRMQKS